jgi:hypothetical protein
VRRISRSPILVWTKKQNKTQKQYEQQCQSHNCSETINNSIYDSDFSITTFPLTSSLPTVGKGQ